ncbi:Protein ZINC INDUCED FACILITATOR-LIKE 1 [Grifola frondosa]|uniref:Protein ZINC INDUCED FACILITATOR-LIKE 1 n=1 Tax=Grifola frondosa TaxID=5627 RepID=A0A1C7M8A1_GRIFR|nr:Protein ZINC INDUCED FACILITATOR-LIKE 1 [Grifola frondosa]
MRRGDCSLPQTERKTVKTPTPLPKLQISILLLLQLAEPITSQCIYPFINQLISELDITGVDERKVGYYAGLIESIFFATEALAMYLDGLLRPPKTFLALVISRSIVGMLNGNIGVIKCMMAELTDSTNIAQGFALMPVVWSVGGTVGPLMGGQLAKPHDRWPSVFKAPFWTRFPYFLPCAASSVFSATIFIITALFLKETVEKSNRTKSNQPPVMAKAGSCGVS